MGDIPYSPLLLHICTLRGKDCKAGQTMSDWDEEEENSTPTSSNPSSRATKNVLQTEVL